MVVVVFFHSNTVGVGTHHAQRQAVSAAGAPKRETTIETGNGATASIKAEAPPDKLYKTNFAVCPMLNARKSLEHNTVSCIAFSPLSKS